MYSLAGYGLGVWRCIVRVGRIELYGNMWGLKGELQGSIGMRQRTFSGG